VVLLKGGESTYDLMKLQELINYLESAKQKVGANVDVYLFDENDYYRFDVDESSQVCDIMIRGEQSMMSKETEDTCLVIKYN
jgi:hypothetical protein